jgi:glycosyltransferase involved in cell wall biosynthesis
MNLFTAKIIHIVPKMDLGGVEESTKLLLLQLHSRGTSVILISSGGRFCEALSMSGIPVYLAPVDSRNPITLFFNIFRIAKIIKKESAAIIHCHSRAPAWSSYFSALLTNSRLITTFHSYYGHRLMKKFYSRIMTKSDLVITPSNELRCHIIKTYDTNPEKVIYLPHFVDVFPQVNPSSTNQFKHQYEIPQNSRILTLVSRSSRWKNVDLAIQALSILSDINIVLLIIGASKDRGKNQSKVYPPLKINLIPNIKFIDGTRNNIAHAFSISSCLLSVSSTKPEGFGMTILEALSCSLPVIATNHGGAVDLIDHKKNGFLFEPHDTLDLALKVKMLLALNKEEILQMRSEAFNKASRYNPDFIVPKLQIIYEELANKCYKSN